MRSKKTLVQIAVYGLVCLVILALPLVINDDFLLNRIDRYLVLHGPVAVASWGYANPQSRQAMSFGIGFHCMAMGLKLGPFRY
jgi:urea transport system permease protein